MKKLTFLSFILSVVILMASGTAFADRDGDVIAQVKKLKDILDLKYTGTRGMVVYTESINVRGMLMEYVKLVHPKTNSKYEIILNNDVTTPSGYKMGSYASFETPREIMSHIIQKTAVKEKWSLDWAPQFTGDMDSAFKTLANLGAVMGFDNAKNACGKDEIYFLVIDRKSRTVFSLETSPCGKK